MGRYYDSTSKSGRQSFGKYVIPALRVESVIPAGAGADVVLTLDLNNLTNNRYAMPWQFRDPGFERLRDDRGAPQVTPWAGAVALLLAATPPAEVAVIVAGGGAGPASRA